MRTVIRKITITLPYDSEVTFKSEDSGGCDGNIAWSTFYTVISDKPYAWCWLATSSLLLSVMIVFADQP